MLFTDASEYEANDAVIATVDACKTGKVLGCPGCEGDIVAATAEAEKDDKDADELGTRLPNMALSFAAPCRSLVEDGTRTV